MKMEGNIMETFITELKKLNVEYTMEKNKLVVKGGVLIYLVHL